MRLNRVSVSFPVFPDDPGFTLKSKALANNFLTPQDATINRAYVKTGDRILFPFYGEYQYLIKDELTVFLSVAFQAAFEYSAGLLGSGNLNRLLHGDLCPLGQFISV